MNNASLELGGTNWAEKDGNLLGYAVGDTSGRYVPREFDFSRGSNLAATRVNENGLIEKGRENLLLQSNNFNTSWVKSSSTVTSGQSGYDGSSGAWLLEKVGAYGRLDQSKSFLGVQTFSLYVKLVDPAQANGVSLRVDIPGNIAQTNFNLETQVITESNSFSSIIEQVGNDGWYRCSTTYVGSGTVARIYVALNGQTNLATGSLLIQDTQIEQGLVATDYIESGATTAQAGILENTPRLDYSSGATVPSLLLEPSRTNLLPQSEPFSGGDWILFANSTIESNFGISPEGVQNAAKVSSSGGVNDFIYDVVNVVSGVTYTVSCFVKNIDSLRTKVYGVNTTDFEIYWNGAEINSVVGTNVDYEDYGNGWYRVWQTSTATGTAFVSRFYPDNQTSGGGSTLLYGYQAESGAYPTSYIPNHSGGTITRSADFCGNAGNSSTFNSTEGVLYLEASAIDNGSSEKGLALNDGSTNNRMNIRIVNNDIKAIGIVGGSLVCLMTYTAPSVTGINKIAFKYKENDFALWVNGVERVTDNSGSIFPANTLNELSFDYGGASAFFYGNVKQVLTFKTALTDQELSDLTNPYKSYSEFVTGEGFTWESQDCTNNSIAVLKSLS